MLRSRIIKWSVDASENLDNVLKTGSMFFSKIVFIYNQILEYTFRTLYKFSDASTDHLIILNLNNNFEVFQRRRGIRWRKCPFC